MIMSDLVNMLKESGFTQSKWQTPEFMSYMRQRENGCVDLVRFPNPGFERDIEVCTWVSEEELRVFLKNGGLESA